MPFWTRLFSTTALLVVVLASSAAAQYSNKVLIEGAKIIPMVGDPIEKGSVLIEDGKIVAVGADLKAPFDAKVIDATGKVVFPGMINPFSSGGLDVPNESVPVVPFVKAADAIDPSSEFFQNALRYGVTSLHIGQGPNTVISGVSSVVRPVGMMVPEMTVHPEAGLGVVFAATGGRDYSVQLATLRSAFRNLDRYLDRLGEKLYEEQEKKAGREVRVSPKEARKLGAKLIKPSKIEDRYRNLWRLRRGQLDAYLYAARAMDVVNAKAFMAKEKLASSSTFVLGAEAHLAAKMLTGLSRPVILPTSAMVFREVDRITREDREVFVPSVLLKHDIAFAVSGADEPWYEAARLVRNGVPRKKALEAITINAAKAVGLGGRLGSLEKGKDANLLILSGDPLDAMTWVEHVFIEGTHVYDQSRDVRLRPLLQGIYDSKQEQKRKAEKAAKKDSKSDAKPSDAKKSKPAGGKKESAAPATESKKN